MDKMKTRILLISLLLILLFSVQSVVVATDDDGNLTSENIDLSICDNTGDVSSDGLSVPYESNNQDEMLSANPGTFSQLTSEITSTTNGTVLDNKTYETGKLLYAALTDDKGNNIKFKVNDEKVSVTSYKNGVSSYDAYSIGFEHEYAIKATSTDENKLNVKTDPLKVGTLTDLADKIFDAIVNHDGILDLTYDFAYDEDIDGEEYIYGIMIEGSSLLTINGNNHIISGSKLSGIINTALEDSVVTFNDITFTNTLAGAIYNSESKLIINNCKFINNTDYYDGAYDEGGAIIGWGEDITLTNCVFINNTAKDGGAIFMEDADITLTNCAFINNTAAGDGFDSGIGGAISFDSTEHTLTVNNCIFTNNIASTSAASSDYTPHGGAIDAAGSVIITNSNFTGNNAENGGAIHMYLGIISIDNCNFTGNNASYGSAIYLKNPQNTNSIPTPCNISNSIFLNNRADANEFYVTKNKDNITLTFTGWDNLLNAVYSEVDVKLTNVTYWDAKGISNTGSSPITPSRSNKESGQNVTVKGVVNGNILSATKVTDAEGKIVLEDVYGVYKITVLHDADSYYTKAEKIIVNKANTKVLAEDIKGNASEKTDIKVKIVDEKSHPVKNGTATLTIDGKTYTAEVINGTATFKDVVLPEKNTVADVYYHGNDYYNTSSTTISIKVKQNNTDPDNNNTDENKTTKHVSSEIADRNATGNPIAMMLLALCALVIIYRKK